MLDLLFSLDRASHTHVQRRDFLRVCAAAAAAVGLPKGAAAAFADNAVVGRKPSVIWLSFMECTGCTESLLRTGHPELSDLIFDLISLDYHETLFVAAGHQAEAAREAAMKKHAGRYILVIEGAIPVKDDGIYCQVGGRTALDIVKEAAEHAGAIIAIGSCASWGGVASADPNPTGATGAPKVLAGKTVVTIPGCPPNPYNLMGVVLQYATFGTLPALDDKGRPVFAYGRTIHEDCPRRPHFDAGRFAKTYGDQAHRDGHCLYLLGCKGPQTYANCSLQSFCEVPGAWPVGIGHPCVGCTEEGIGFNVAIAQTIPIAKRTPSAEVAPITADHGGVSPVATGVAGIIGGALAATGVFASRQLKKQELADALEPPHEPALAKEQKPVAHGED